MQNLGLGSGRRRRAARPSSGSGRLGDPGGFPVLTKGRTDKAKTYPGVRNNLCPCPCHILVRLKGWSMVCQIH